MKNYIFDFDGTLADSGSTAILATQQAFQQAGLAEPSAEEIAYYMGIPIEVSFPKMAAAALEENEFQTLLTNFRLHYKQLENEHLTLFPTIDTVLKQLVDEGKQLFVVSSKHSTALVRNLTTLAIADYFLGVSGSDQVENYKPAPDGVLAILNGFQLVPAETVMIGDAIYDLQMGKAAGVQTCGVTWGAHNSAELEKEQPDYLVESVLDLLTI